MNLLQMMNGQSCIQRCPRCHGECNENGLCARCLLRDGIEDLPDLPSEADRPESPSKTVFESLPVIQGYEIISEIGRGGMGVVYLAEQLKPVRRRVALKLIKLGMDTKQVIARFEAEQQALALMEHPNVAKVLGAGTSDSGRPYFVMEFVRGPRITEYCDEHQLSTRERLELFLQICRAIQHAHHKGVIHRDIKPSNILVTQEDGVAVPKVIDFGIAKATSGTCLTDKTLVTCFEQFLGTPAYTSPEQIEGSGQVDTRTDVYSLGVLLYELLTGKTPFDSKELLRSGWDHMRRTIRESDPQKPSTKLTSLDINELTRVARNRRSEPPRLVQSLRGDLDWIVMNCLEKEPARRYESCTGIALEISRYLNHEPVTVRPAGNLYRAEKWVRRHRLLCISGASILAAMAAALSISGWALTRELRARAQIEEARNTLISAENLKSNVNKAATILIRDEIQRVPALIANPMTVQEILAGKRRMDEIEVRLTSNHVQEALAEVSNSVSASAAEFQHSRSHQFHVALASASNYPPTAVAEAQVSASNSAHQDLRDVSDYLPALMADPSGGADLLQLTSGATYKEWAAKWWKWFMEIPLTDLDTGATHPVIDSSAFDPTDGRINDQVTFLASPFGTVYRSCTISPDTYLLVGLLNVESSSLEKGTFHSETAKEQLKIAIQFADHITDLFCMIDGVPIPNIGSYRFANDQITFDAPTPWIFGDIGGHGTSCGDGYYVMFKPMLSGTHILHYGGAFKFTTAVDGFDLYAPMDVTYTLLVP